MTYQRKNIQSSFTYSSMEPRRLLAGDVTAFEFGEHLYIRGDSESNQIRILGQLDGTLSIRGAQGTTINGSKDPFVIEGLEFLEGSNQYSEPVARFAGGLRVHMGAGDDSFSLYGAEFEQKSVIYGGLGHDDIFLSANKFNDKVIVQTYHGNDVLNVERNEFLDDFYALTLDGEDSVSIFESTMRGDSIVATGQHSDHVVSQNSDYFGDTQLILTHSGDDVIEVMIPSVNANGFFALGGSGGDHLKGLFGNDVSGSIVMAGQTGDDIGEMSTADSIAPMMKFNTMETMHQAAFVNVAPDGELENEAYRDVRYPAESYFHTQVFDNFEYGRGAYYANNFQFEEATVISKIDWTGTYAQTLIEIPGDIVGEILEPETDDFRINIYESEEVNGKQVPLETPTWVLNPGNDVNRVRSEKGTHLDEYYDYSTAVNLEFEAGEKYWISIYSESDTDSSFQMAYGFYKGFQLDDSDDLPSGNDGKTHDTEFAYKALETFSGEVEDPTWLDETHNMKYYALDFTLWTTS
ncbi:MAG: hypothetical protein AB8B55_13580 [Mariniblastus sp.]